MRDFGKGFYNTATWQRCRNAYVKSVGGLCEGCLEKGQYNPGIIVHHIVELTAENINDPDIALSWDNLRLLCRDCHALVHSKNVRRYKVDSAGRLVF